MENLSKRDSFPVISKLKVNSSLHKIKKSEK